EKLMELQERWQANQARKAFDEAIAAAKAKIKPIVKNREVDFTTAKGRTNYQYEDLAMIASEVDPILSEVGLSYRYRARQDGNKVSVTCVIAHREGHSEETTLTALNDESGNKNSIQAIGSAVTYLQRYTLKLALGLAATKDDDGNSIGGPEKITEQQAADLKKLAEEVGANLDQFKRYLRVQELTDLPASKYADAVAALNKKRQAK
ncbi:MAG TPA: ERF family protein, partial [Steroidobacteraceae bacterium]|nr:ERF family protein [Steroidobacteraceae bacterium]